MSAAVKAKYVFKRPDSYYQIAGIDVRHVGAIPALELDPRTIRVRQTKSRGQVAITRSYVTFRTGPWADRHDAIAQMYVAIGRRWSLMHSTPARVAIRHYCEQYLGVRPKLDVLSRAEIEVAELLRAEAAVRMLEKEIRHEA